MEIPSQILRSVFQNFSLIEETGCKIKISLVAIDNSNHRSYQTKNTQINNNKSNSSYLQEKISILVKKFIGLMDQGKELEPVPSELISKIIDTIISMQSLDPRKISKRILERFSSLGHQLSIKLDEYSRKISNEDGFE